MNVFVKPPSAELSPDQEDEKSLGIDYATLDRILVAAVEHGRAPEAVAAALVAEGREAEATRRLVDDVLARRPGHDAPDKRHPGQAAPNHKGRGGERDGP